MLGRGSYWHGCYGIFGRFVGGVGIGRELGVVGSAELEVFWRRGPAVWLDGAGLTVRCGLESCFWGGLQLNVVFFHDCNEKLEFYVEGYWAVVWPLKDYWVEGRDGVALGCREGHCESDTDNEIHWYVGS